MTYISMQQEWYNFWNVEFPNYLRLILIIALAIILLRKLLRIRGLFNLLVVVIAFIPFVILEGLKYIRG